jgi:Type IV conjugative transfer system lipoprotein (TraV)
MNKLTAMMLFPLLTSCAGVYDQGFDCPAEKGVGCKSISQVNSMVDKGELNKSSIICKGSGCNIGEPPSKPKLILKRFDCIGIKRSNLPGEKVIRIPEKTQRIWIASHEDIEGSFIEESFMHTVIDTGKWQEQ